MKATTTVDISVELWIERLRALTQAGVKFITPPRFPTNSIKDGKAVINFEIKNSFLSGLQSEVTYIEHCTKGIKEEEPVDPEQPDGEKKEVIYEVSSVEKLAHYNIYKTAEQVDFMLNYYKDEVPQEIQGTERIKQIFALAFIDDIVAFESFGLTKDQWIIES